MTAVEELREAAKVLRERAGLATPGPWHIGNAVDPTTTCNIHAFPSARGIAEDVGWLDAEWIATMNPLVGLALADWLDRTIADFEWPGIEELAGGLYEESTDDYPGRIREDWTAAWRLARLILGGEPT